MGGFRGNLSETRPNFHDRGITGMAKPEKHLPLAIRPTLERESILSL